MTEDTGNAEKTGLTPEETEALEAEELLGEASGMGFSLAIHRTDPKWCAGYLDTWPLEGPISLAEIRDAYGGRRFRLKILGKKGRYVRDLVVSIDDIPRRRGIPVKPAGLEFEKDIPAAPAPAAPAIDLAGFLERANDRQLAMMDRLLAARANATPAPAPAPNPVDQIQALAEAVTKIREVSNLFGVEQDSTNTLLEGFIKLLDAKEKASAAQTRRRQLPPPQAQRRQVGPPGAPGHHGPPGPPGPRPQQQQQPGPPPQEQHQAPGGGEHNPGLAPVPDEPEPEDLDPVELLAQFEPTDAGLAIREYFDGLSPLDAQRALSAVLGQEVTLDDLSTLRAQSGNGAADPSAADHGPQDPPE